MALPAGAAQECVESGLREEDVRIGSPIVEALGNCGIRVSGISEGLCLT